jgi:hypothetical protein
MPVINWKNVGLQNAAAPATYFEQGTDAFASGFASFKAAGQTIADQATAADTKKVSNFNAILGAAKTPDQLNTARAALYDLDVRDKAPIQRAFDVKARDMAGEQSLLAALDNTDPTQIVAVREKLHADTLASEGRIIADQRVASFDAAQDKKNTLPPQLQQRYDEGLSIMNQEQAAVRAQEEQELAVARSRVPALRLEGQERLAAMNDLYVKALERWPDSSGGGDKGGKDLAAKIDEIAAQYPEASTDAIFNALLQSGDVDNLVFDESVDINKFTKAMKLNAAKELRNRKTRTDEWHALQNQKFQNSLKDPTNKITATRNYNKQFNEQYGTRVQ